MKVLMPIPELDFDPTEVAVTWRSLKDRGIQVVFATPTGGESEADHLMLTGEGLDAWGAIPLFKKVPLLGLFLRADAQARRSYAELEGDPSFQDPIKFADMRIEDVDGLVLPGGHRARGMQEYLESNALRKFVGAFFESGKPVGAICHGVLVAARSRSPLTGKSVLYGRKTTALTWPLERRAWRMTRFLGRFWDPNYFRTYVERKGQPAGSKSVEAEVKAYLEKPTDFKDVEGTFMDRVRKSSGLFRDSANEDWPAFVVVDGNYVSARWPGDAYSFAAKFGDLVIASVDRHQSTAVMRAISDAPKVADPKYDPFAQTQIVSRMPKPANPDADMNHTIIIKSPLLAEREKAAAAAAAAAAALAAAAEGAAKPAVDSDATVINVPRDIETARIAVDAAVNVAPPAIVANSEMPIDSTVVEAVEPIAQADVGAPSAEHLLQHSEEPPEAHATVDDFAKTTVLAESPLAPDLPVDDFAKTQVLAEPPIQSNQTADDFAKTQVLAEPPILSPAPVDDFAKTEVMAEPPLQSHESVDDFAKTQVLSEPPIQAARPAKSDPPAISEPPIVPAAPVDDFEKTQIMSRPPGSRMTSAVDDFDRTLIIKRPAKEELENPQV